MMGFEAGGDSVKLKLVPTVCVYMRVYDVSGWLLVLLDVHHSVHALGSVQSG